MMDISWLTNTTHFMRADELSDFLAFHGCRNIEIGVFHNVIDGNGFPNEMINRVMFSFKQERQWLTFEGYFHDVTKFDPTIPPTAKFTLTFTDPADS